MRRSHRLVAALASMAAAMLPFATAGHAQAKLPVHVMPNRLLAPTRPAVSTSPITFHGGAVMTGHVNVYLIWYGNWPAKVARRSIITDFVQHLPSPYWSINQTFPSAAGKTVANDISLAGQTDDHYSVGKSQITDDQINTVVTKAIQSKALPKDPQGVYLVLTSSDVTKVGFLTQYCGWHSFGQILGTTIKFGFIGDPSGPHVRLCSPQNGSPNGDTGADAMVSTIAHELDEAVTDPTMKGWYSATGEENADRCAWQYIVTYKAGSQVANVKLGSRNYLIQANWVNSAKPHCGLRP